MHCRPGSVSAMGSRAAHAPDEESDVSLPPSADSEGEERAEEYVFMEVYSVPRIATVVAARGMLVGPSTTALTSRTACSGSAAMWRWKHTGRWS